jgi:hypothetical protein
MYAPLLMLPILLRILKVLRFLLYIGYFSIQGPLLWHDFFLIVCKGVTVSQRSVIYTEMCSLCPRLWRYFVCHIQCYETSSVELLLLIVFQDSIYAEKHSFCRILWRYFLCCIRCFQTSPIPRRILFFQDCDDLLCAPFIVLRRHLYWTHTFCPRLWRYFIVYAGISISGCLL